jgi:hypothetical protein
LYKHEDILDEITANIPFIIEMNNNQPILKLKSDFNNLDCEIKETYRLYIRAYDCASNGKRRYSERYVRERKIFSFTCLHFSQAKSSDCLIKY